MQTSYVYRGWNVEFVYQPIPFRGCDWQATHPDFDGDEDGRSVSGSSRAEVQAAVDEWIEENSDEALPGLRNPRGCALIIFGTAVLWLVIAIVAYRLYHG